MIEACFEKTKQFPAGQEIVARCTRPEAVHVILSGYAGCLKSLPDRQRQIVAYFLPGDTCNLNVAILGHMDHSIIALSPCEVAYFSTSVLEELLSRQALARALLWTTLVDEGVSREWLLNMGQRSSERRMAHLFCELRYRLAAVDLVEDESFSFPLTQVQLADTLGITAVHANRMLQQLRALGLIELKRGQLKILDLGDLENFCDFDSRYLHLELRSPRQDMHHRT